MSRFTKNEFLFFLCIFILGAFLRLYHLDYPLGLHGDEALTGLEASKILKEGPISIWSSSSFGQASFPLYWTAFIFKFFGKNIYSLRLSFTLLSVISLPFFYFSVRCLFSKNIALLAFFLFSIARVPVHFSHIAYASYLMPFLPAIFFLILALKENKMRYFILSGVFVGLSPYFYQGLRIFPIFIILFLFYKFFKKSLSKKYLVNLIIFFITSFVFFLPLGRYSLLHPDTYWSRTESISIFSKQGLKHIQTSYYGNSSFVRILFKQIKKTGSMFILKGDGDSQDNNQNLPLLDPLSGFFFIIGFCFLLLRSRNDPTIFLYLWFFIFLTGSIFTVDAPNFRRIQPSIAASYVFVALGIIYIYNYLKPLSKLNHILNLLIAMILVVVTWNNISTYFGQQAISSETKSAFSYQLVKASEFINTIPNSYVYFYSARWSYHYETLRFLLHDIPGEDRSSQFGTYSLINNNFGKTVVYLFLPDYQDSFFQVQKMYPNGRTIIKKDTDKTILFYSYIIPKKL